MSDFSLGSLSPRRSGHGAVPLASLLRPLVHVRALRAGDEAACRAFGARLTPEDLRLRFAAPVRFEDGPCRRLFEIDESRDTVLVALDEDEAVAGIGRLARISAVEAEFALIVRSDLKGNGIGSRLLAALLDRSRALGIRTVWGDILDENRPMRRLAASFGFRAMGEPGLLVRVRLDLEAPAARLDRQPCSFPF